MDAADRAERFIETVGAAWFKTKAVAYPVELVLTTSRQASNIERLKLSRALEGLLGQVIEGGIPENRFLQPPGGNPLQYLQSREGAALAAGTTVECASAEEVQQLHGLAAKAEHGEFTLSYSDLPAVYGEQAEDRARALRRALDAAGQAAAAIAHEAGVGLAGLFWAREVDVGAALPAMDEQAPRRVAVRLSARFAIR